MDNEGHSYQWSQLPRRMKPFETTLLKIHVTFNGIYKYFLFQPLPLLYQLCFISVYLSYLLLTSFLLLSFLISSLYFSPLPLERRVGAAGSLRSDGGNYCEWHRRQIRLRGPQEHQWRQWQREVDLAAPPSGEADSWPLAPGVMMAAAANSGDVRVSASSGQGFDFGFFIFFFACGQHKHPHEKNSDFRNTFRRTGGSTARKNRFCPFEKDCFLVVRSRRDLSRSTFLYLTFRAFFSLHNLGLVQFSWEKFLGLIITSDIQTRI